MPTRTMAATESNEQEKGTKACEGNSRRNQSQRYYFLVAREHLQQTMATGKSAVCATRPKKSLVLYPPVVVHAVPMTLRIQIG